MLNKYLDFIYSEDVGNIKNTMINDMMLRASQTDHPTEVGLAIKRFFNLLLFLYFGKFFF